MSAHDIIRDDDWDLTDDAVDGKPGYSPEKFYFRTKDKNGESTSHTTRMPATLFGMGMALVNNPATPFATSSDFARNAWRLACWYYAQPDKFNDPELLAQIDVETQVHLNERRDAHRVNAERIAREFRDLITDAQRDEDYRDMHRLCNEYESLLDRLTPRLQRDVEKEIQQARDTLMLHRLEWRNQR